MDNGIFCNLDIISYFQAIVFLIKCQYIVISNCCVNYEFHLN